MTERRAPYRTHPRRPLEPQAPARRPQPTEFEHAESLLRALDTYYRPQGWAGIEGALAARCKVTIQGLLALLDVAQRRRAHETSQTEGNAPHDKHD